MYSLVEQIHKSRKIYTGKTISFLSDIVILPNKKKGIREYTVHPGAVAIIPFLNKKDILLVKQYRYPVRKILYELPAGKVNKGENLVKCTQRELIEETGYSAHRIKKLISYYPTPAFSTEVIHIFVGYNLSPCKHSADKDEFIEPVRVTFQEALSWIVSGKIQDSKTIIGLLYYKLLCKKTI